MMKAGALAVEARLPSMHRTRRGVVDGGLMSYGPDVSDLHRRSAVYVDKIVKGAKVGDLPGERPTTGKRSSLRKISVELEKGRPTSMSEAGRTIRTALN